MGAVSVVVLIIAGILVEQGLQIYFNSKKPGPVEFCKIGARNIHFVKKSNGVPTIVFQAGLGGDYIACFCSWE